jgi:hypothetical protein
MRMNLVNLETLADYAARLFEHIGLLWRVYPRNLLLEPSCMLLFLRTDIEIKLRIKEEVGF